MVASSTLSRRTKMAVTSETTTEELADILKNIGTPAIIISKLKDEFVDGESFLDMSSNLEYLNLIPQYGLQVKFRRLYTRVTGKELMLPTIHVQERLKGSEDTLCIPKEPVICELPSSPASVAETEITGADIRTEEKPVPFPAPLPQFSPLVQQRLDRGQVESIWHKFIAELAEYYIGMDFNISSHSEYRNVGQTLVSKFPVLSVTQQGTPWAVLCKALSAKVRNLRVHLRRKSTQFPKRRISFNQVSCQGSVKRAKFDKAAIPSSQPDISAEKYEEYVQEIQEQWDRNRRDDNHIRMLMRNTFQGRRKWMTTVPDGAVAIIIQTFPPFKDEVAVMDEMKVLLGEEKCANIADNFTRLMGKLDELQGKEPLSRDCDVAEIDMRDLKNVDYLFKSTKFDKGKGEKSLPCWTVVKEGDDPEKAMKTKVKDPPHLFLCISETDAIVAAYICADGIRLFECLDIGMPACMVSLMSAYYAFDLEFPRIYAQMLGFIQHYVVGQAYCGKKSTKYSKFEDRFLKNLKQH